MMDTYNDNKFPAIKRVRTARMVRAIERGKMKALSTPGGRCLCVAGVIAFLITLCIQLFHSSKILIPICLLGDFLAAIFITAFIFYNLGRPSEYRKYEEAFTRLGFVDALGFPPEVAGINRDSRSFELCLLNCGKALSEWQDRRAEIETALGVVVSKISLERGKQTLTLTCVPADKAFKDYEGRNVFSSKSLAIRIGFKADGEEVIDLNRTAHVLIGGATGSGKTVLLRTILVMLIHKGCTVLICDFKGGIDFPEDIWRETALITTYDELIEKLESVMYELEDRKRLFLMYGVKNIEEYNACSDTDSIPHIAVATDEVAEMLDRTGRKDDKPKIDKVTEMLSTIARLGRAYGIHLILATQRPDANVIPGQIKNNLTYRACGHADKVLSQIVIDSTDAAEIPPDYPGRFITDTGEEFQALMLSDFFFSR